MVPAVIIVFSFTSSPPPACNPLPAVLSVLSSNARGAPTRSQPQGAPGRGSATPEVNSPVVFLRWNFALYLWPGHTRGLIVFGHLTATRRGSFRYQFQRQPRSINTEATGSDGFSQKRTTRNTDPESTATGAPGSIQPYATSGESGTIPSKTTGLRRAFRRLEGQPDTRGRRRRRPHTIVGLGSGNGGSRRRSVSPQGRSGVAGCLPNFLR